MNRPDSAAKFEPSDGSDLPLVAIAGGTGFVGTQLVSHLSPYSRIRVLTRSESRAASSREKKVPEWVRCDLFSLPQVEKALQGADIAVYLVHSMLPSARLSQGSFADLDLLLADNFARAASASGVKHIIYLSGLIPEECTHLSPHLASRLEVEKVLRAGDTPVTVIRAGIIFGAGGSSAAMLLNLVRRLPVMILPKWTSSTIQSVDIEHICKAFSVIVRDPHDFVGVYDIASHPPMTYANMIAETAAFLSSSYRGIRFPFHFISLSRLWVSLFSGVSPALVNPLLESLRHELRARPNRLTEIACQPPISFADSVRCSVDKRGRPLPNPRGHSQTRDNRLIRQARQVRSVQRLPLPPDWDATRVATSYGNWLARTFRGLVKVPRSDDGVLRFYAPFGLLLLELSPSPATTTGNRRVFYITGGILARPEKNPTGRLEFRVISGGREIIAAVHGFVPRLPWYLYEWTQARIHLWVMRSFRKYLEAESAVVESS